MVEKIQWVIYMPSLHTYMYMQYIHPLIHINTSMFAKWI